ncbi:DUF5357 domain-containing protein [Trichothermofontia sichuanensis B231]|uniref:DUF5357 family protein n=1 Tax=Trichothermofontia sichuanensis TaxID=3045816 RepID=UPI0022475A9A|nr:DUF5357 family protein [Trichothermofontia sichuanensis]UZQ55669.1 DUF5357 domain-containing protein [Trichothermofontia sichuanensis B231]
MKKLKDYIQKIDDFLYKWVKILIPPQTSSWQTFFLVSISSFFLAQFANAPFLQIILKTLGWLFALISVHWWTFQNSDKVSIAKQFFIGPWLTGLLVCLVLLKEWIVPYPDRVLIYTAASWPLVSVAIAIWPRFSDPGVRFVGTDDDPEKYQKIIDNRRDIMLLVLGNLILSCWLRFYFIVAKWVELSYPSR